MWSICTDCWWMTVRIFCRVQHSAVAKSHAARSPSICRWSPARTNVTWSPAAPCLVSPPNWANAHTAVHTLDTLCHCFWSDYRRDTLSMNSWDWDDPIYCSSQLNSKFRGNVLTFSGGWWGNRKQLWIRLHSREKLSQRVRWRSRERSECKCWDRWSAILALILSTPHLLASNCLRTCWGGCLVNRCSNAVAFWWWISSLYSTARAAFSSYSSNPFSVP